MIQRRKCYLSHIWRPEWFQEISLGTVWGKLMHHCLGDLLRILLQKCGHKMIKSQPRVVVVNMERKRDGGTNTDEKEQKHSLNQRNFSYSLEGN